MSLDIDLIIEEIKQCKTCGHVIDYGDRVSFNITHNLNTMADHAGIYKALWGPEQIGIEVASQLVPILQGGISLMESDPERFMKFDAQNGWGTYHDFLPWLRKLLKACEKNPEARIEVCI